MATYYEIKTPERGPMTAEFWGECWELGRVGVRDDQFVVVADPGDGSSRPIAEMILSLLNKGTDWIEFGRTYGEFRAEGLHTPGVEFLVAGSDRPELIGDLSESGGTCDCCSSYKKSDVVVKYRVLVKRD